MLRTKLIEAPRWGHIGLTRRLAIPAAAVAAVLVVTACGSSGNSGTSGPAANKKPITLLFGSSGPAETSAEKAAAAAFTKKTGIPVNVVAASNLQQQLAQDFAGNTPPNLFYLDPTSMQQYAAKGVLDDYGDSLPNAGDFYPSLKAAFTYHGKMYCAPKDAGALSLYINDADWSAAGLTSADYPTNWTQLATVAKKLTTGGRVGLVTDPNESRLDPFLYQAGGGIVNAAGTKAIMNTPANVQALTFLKSMLSAGSLAFPAKVNEQDEIPALGDNKAAMIISGPWMDGAMQTGFPNVSYSVHPLPAGPTGTKGTLVFTNCWGVPKQNSNLGGTIEFVKFLTTPDQELKFAKAFGALPSLKTMGATFTATFPKRSEELTAVQVGHPDIEIPGATNALNAYNSDLAELATKTPESILSAAQTNLQAAIDAAKAGG